MTFDIHQIADYFISKADANAGDLITHLKLQKVVYYAQAWYLVLNDKELVEDEFEAWVHGPVVRVLYDRFQGLGWHPITTENPVTNPDDLPDDIKEFLNEVWDVYGQFGAKRLEDLTHDELPWQEARNGLSPIQKCEKPISKNTMKSFYRRKLVEENGKN